MVNQLSIYLINNFYQNIIFISLLIKILLTLYKYKQCFNLRYKDIKVISQIKTNKIINNQNNQMETNGVNYYKGVLLCSRPNESPSIPKQKPFCGRVTHQDALELIPCKKFDQHQIRKRNLPVLNNHKKWLEGFKKKIVDQKNHEEQQKRKEIERLQKIKEQGAKRREMFKKSEFATATETTPWDGMNNSNQSKKKQSSPTKEIQVQQSNQTFTNKQKLQQKKEKDQEQEQIDQLLDFFDNQDVKNYLQDQQVNRMLKDLKSRIQQMKNEGNKNGDWKKKQVEKIQQIKQIKLQRADSDKQKKDDILSRMSKNSEARSLASQKTTQRVEQLQRKKKQKEWDKKTVSQKKSHAASVDQQIAKNVADQVLRNYPHLKHHSNQSIRKLLQKQAHQQIKA